MTVDCAAYFDGIRTAVDPDPTALARWQGALADPSEAADQLDRTVTRTRSLSFKKGGWF